MKLDMLLCNAAEIREGLIYILGAGWSSAAPQPTNMVLAGKLEVPWDQTNMEHTLSFELHNKDAQPALPILSHEQGSEPVFGDRLVRGDMKFNLGRPPHVRPGSSLDMPFVFNFGGVWLPEGGYVWQASVDGAIEKDWHISFTVRPQA